MEIFTAILFSHPADPDEAQEISARLVRYLPFGRSAYSINKYISSDRRCMMVTWDNGQSSALYKSSEGAAILSGYGRVGPRLVSTSKVFSASRKDLNRNTYFRRLGGVYTYVEYVEGSDKILAWNTPSRIRPLYYGLSGELAVVSNRAAIASEILNGDCAICWDSDPSTFPFFLLNGYFSSDRTPYRGISTLTGDTCLDIGPGRITKIPISSPWEISGEVDVDDVINRLASSLIDVIAALDSSASSPVLGLSGGKDSRLLLSAVVAHGAQVDLVTNGYDDHPDVIVAKKIAHHFSLPHVTRAPAAGAELIQVNLRKRVYDSIFMTEGMLHPWMQISLPGVRFKRDDNLSGYGGELFRGGFAKYKHKTRSLIRNAQWLSSFFPGKFLRSIEVLEANTSKALSGWADYEMSTDLARSCPAAYADKFYLDFRAGRWAAASFTAREASASKHYPLCDAELIRIAQEASIEERMNDYLMVGVIRRLAPDLLHIPLADNQWAAWADGGMGFPWSDVVPIDPVPLIKSSGRAIIDWRLAVATDMKSAFRELLLEAGQEVCCLVNEAVLFTSLDDGNALKGSTAKVYWNVAGLIATANGGASMHDERKGRESTIRLDRHWPSVESKALRQRKKALEDDSKP